MDVHNVAEATEQLEKAEDNFLGLIERFLHLVKDSCGDRHHSHDANCNSRPQVHSAASSSRLP